jgi:PBP1b-binding outer membrane lipoprotein LpoB
MKKLFAVAVCSAFLFVGCAGSSAKKEEQKVEDAVEAVEEKAQDVYQEATEAVEDAAEAVEDAANALGEKVEEVVE